MVVLAWLPLELQSSLRMQITHLYVELHSEEYRYALSRIGYRTFHGTLRPR